MSIEKLLRIKPRKVAKALDSQQYLMPPTPSQCVGVEVVRGAVALKGPMTYALTYREFILLLLL